MCALNRYGSLILILVFSSCSKPPAQPSGYPLGPNDTYSLQYRVTNLYHFYYRWKGVSYQEGGQTKNGVDCSGFTAIAYRDIFQISLPRTTYKQQDLGRRVSRENLIAGDLIFFKIGWFTEHVGIYLNDGLFLHASTSKGVTLSRLGEKYWSNNFYIAKRILLQ